MNKEKEIEEMVKAQKGVCKQVKQSCGCCKHGKLGICEYNESYRRAKMLVEAGYRKADEVRKETERKIFQELYDMCFELKDPESASDAIKGCLTCEDILWYAKQYGVEVDE